jgi:hypothetical protein
VSGTRPKSRKRAALFGSVAVFCALLSAAAASRRDDSLDAQLGELRTVVVVERPLAKGTRLTGGALRKALGSREVPARFLPPDHLTDPALAAGSKLAADLPAGSYLLASHLRRPRGASRGEQAVGAGLRPVETVVTGSAPPPAGARVDVLAADEPGSTSNPKVRVLARGVELLAIAPLRGEGPADPVAPATGGWLARLALDRPASLRVIEADNYAREVRLLER